jgi:hypothetical protein
MHGRFVVTCLLLLSGVSAAGEGPRASFGFTTHYQTSAAGRGEVLVRQVVPGGPAERAGIERGDLIVAFDGAGFRFANEYEFMRSLEAFEHGRKLNLTLVRAGRELLVPLEPGPLSPGQEEAIAGYMAKLSSCVKTGKDCPCPMDHGHELGANEDFGSSYRKFVDSIAGHGGKTILTIARDAAGVLSYRSAPVPLPEDLEIGPDDDGMLWQRIEALGKGKTLEVEITNDGPDRRRLRILGS